VFLLRGGVLGVFCFTALRPGIKSQSISQSVAFSFPQKSTAQATGDTRENNLIPFFLTILYSPKKQKNKKTLSKNFSLNPRILFDPVPYLLGPNWT